MILGDSQSNAPPLKRAIVFVDWQNLFRCIKEAFQYHFPNYDVKKLAEMVCLQNGWLLSEVRFYTGVPDRTKDPFWASFWEKKFAQMGTRGVKHFKRKLMYDNVSVEPGFVPPSREKGIDVRIALDIVLKTIDNAYDVAVIFSQDQDLSEAVKEAISIAKGQKRFVSMYSAFPASESYKNSSPIRPSKPLIFNKDSYDGCIDPADYRPKNIPPPKRSYSIRTEGVKASIKDGANIIDRRKIIDRQDK